MIKIILSGEGSSDIGEIDYQTGEFMPGPIAVLTRNVLRFHHKDDVRFHFKARKELKQYPITLKGKPQKSKGTAGKGHSILAWKLACVAKDEECDIAILMRDADNREFAPVYEEIRSGFLAAAFDRGIPAVPVPKSEAWIICCMVPERSHRIEDSTREMKELLEEMLRFQHKPRNRETCCEITTDCRVESVLSRSFVQYRNDIERAVRHLY